MKPYQPTDRENALLRCYESASSAAVAGLDAVPDAHLQALNAVAAMVEAETKQRVPDEIQGQNVASLQRVADASSVLLLFVDAATRRRSLLREEVAAVSHRVHVRLREAGYVSRNPRTGHRERPSFPFSVRDLIPEQEATASNAEHGTGAGEWTRKNG